VRTRGGWWEFLEAAVVRKNGGRAAAACESCKTQAKKRNKKVHTGYLGKTRAGPQEKARGRKSRPKPGLARLSGLKIGAELGVKPEIAWPSPSSLALLQLKSFLRAQPDPILGLKMLAQAWPNI
jgi:hypothetical protein